jgi:hypothetical protein
MNDYNQRVASHLTHLFINQLPAVGARHGRFRVQPEMRNVGIVLDLMSKRAEETQRKMRSAAPAMAAVNTRIQINNRNNSRKCQVRSMF